MKTNPKLEHQWCETAVLEPAAAAAAAASSAAAAAALWLGSANPVTLDGAATWGDPSRSISLDSKVSKPATNSLAWVSIQLMASLHLCDNSFLRLSTGLKCRQLRPLIDWALTRLPEQLYHGFTKENWQQWNTGSWSWSTAEITGLVKSCLLISLTLR